MNTIKILVFCRDIPQQIKMNNKIIRDIEEKYYTLDEVQNDGQPKGNSVSSPTESKAINIPEEIYEAILKLKKDNQQLSRLYTEINEEISRLEYKERKVIYEFYICEYKWDKIARGFYSVRQCKNIRVAALKKLGKNFNENSIIKSLLKNA